MRRLLLCLALVTGCAHTAAPRLAPIDAARQRVLAQEAGWWGDTIPILRFKAPFAYGYWRLEVERCAGQRRDGWPDLYLAPILPIREDGAYAVYSPPSNAIIFGLGVVDVAWLVRHELLHFLLAPLKLTEDHPPEYFDAEAGKCGALVNPTKPGS